VPAEERVIVVSGVGSASAPPDSIRLVLGVEVQGATPGQALKEAGRQANTLLSVFDEYGVAGQARQTSQLSVFHRPDLGGHVAISTLSVTLTDLGVASTVLEQAADTVGDVLRVNQVAWSLQNPAPLLAQARRSAVADAAERARQLADAAEVELGSLQSMVENPTMAGPMPRFALAAAGRSGPAVPIEAGEQQVMVTVQLTYNIPDT
jgi:uncharacterized protein YggE